MRIVVLAHGFPPAAQGGSEIYAYQHARALARLGHDLLVVTREADRSRPERAVRQEQRDGLLITWVNNTFADTHDLVDSWEHPRLADVVMPVIDAFGPDVAHAHHLTCLSTRLVYVLSARGVPIVYTLHDYWLQCHRGQFLNRRYEACAGPGDHGCGNCIEEGTLPVVSALKRAGLARLAANTLPPRTTAALSAAAASFRSAPGGTSSLEERRVRHMRDVCSRISHFLAPSTHMRDAFLAFGLPPARVSVSPYGFDHGAFARAVSAAPPSRPLRLGFIGSLMVSKAPHVLLEAHDRLPSGAAEVHLYGTRTGYHGDDSYGERLSSALTAPGVHVHGPRPHAEIPAVLAELDLLVVPSIWPENSPLVIQEALLAGVPVVASRIGGITELVRDGINGRLFGPGRSDELADILRQMADDPSALTRLRQANTTIRTIDDDARAAVDLYQSLRSAEPARPARRTTAAVVVHYRTPVQTELALRALRASALPLDDLIVVNNDDVDDAAGRLRPLATEWIDTGSNLGFSGGVNAGIRAALARGADTVLLVNSDAVVPPDTVARLHAALGADPGAGIAAPVITSLTRPDVVASAGISYDRRTGRMRHRGFNMRLEAAQPSLPRLVDAASGCVMLVRREVFEAVGMFEEAYFYGFEDIDFCLSARARGWRTVLAPDAVVYHHGGQSIGPTSTRRLYFGTRNHLLLAQRIGAGDPSFVKAARTLWLIGLNAAHAARSPGATLPGRLASVARGAWDYRAGRFGADRTAPEGPADGS